MFTYIHLFQLVWILFIYFYSLLPYFLSFFPVLPLNFLFLLSSIQLLHLPRSRFKLRGRAPVGASYAVRERLSITQSGPPASAQAGWRGRSALAIPSGLGPQSLPAAIAEGARDLGPSGVLQATRMEGQAAGSYRVNSGTLPPTLGSEVG